MGIVVTVKVEGEDQSLIEERTDGKPLADIVAGWIWYPEAVKLLSLSPASTQALQRVDYSTYDEKGEVPKDVWQDPTALITAFKELKIIFEKVQINSSFIEEMDNALKGNATEYFKQEWYEGYIYGIEDGIKVCELAAQRKKRVCLVAD